MASHLRKTGVRAALGVVAAVGGVGVLARVQRARYRLTEDPETNAARAVVGPDGVVHTDVLVVGSGGTALTAALRAQSLGLRTLVVEKSRQLGGTTCFSGSGCWIPNTHLHAGTGVDDSMDKALTYLESIIGDAGPASSPERRRSFLEQGPQMARWLETAGYRWRRTPVYPDYFPDHPGALVGGRNIEAHLFDAGLLGPQWRARLNVNPTRAPLPLYTDELGPVLRAGCSWDGRWTAARIWAGRLWPGRYWLGGDPVCLGVSMISQLLYLNVQRGTPIWTESPLVELTVDGTTGRVTGAVVQHAGRPVRVAAARGVILAAGGFARNAAMRKAHQTPPVDTSWSSACDTDEGDAIQAAVRVGAATALMDSAWWGAAMVDPASGRAIWCNYDRVLPHSMIVDQRGERFLNEAQNYNALGTAIWQRHRQGLPAIPAFFIMDATHRKRYLLAGRFMPGAPIPQKDLDSGLVTQADSLAELAARLGVDAAGLERTTARFNTFADTGVDADFGRGGNAYDFRLGDPAYGRRTGNRNLGRIETPPFTAVRLYPGDLGTKGGVLTDERGRALTAAGKVIPGLYAAGNSSASVMGRTYAGAGATLGPALTFAYIAATECAD